jgi:hypothetical protein
MKQQVSPIVAVVIIVIVIAVAVFAYMKAGGGGPGSKAGEKPPGMPPNVAAEFQRRMGGITGPQGAPGPAPSGPGAASGK